MKRAAIPEKLLEKLRRAGQRRAAQMTRADRQKYGRKAWQTRLARAVAAEWEKAKVAQNTKET